ncbi:MAG: PHP domain-containing protein [Acidimicrobiia bacterium]|nr:PHP domain-containing protein [Acidimicrobiia bacterium]
MAADLHTHSNASDGSDSPSQLMRRAATQGLTTVALTDHDTLEGLEEAKASADEFGVGFVPGVELSLEWDKGGMHLIVLWLEPGPGPLQDRLAGLQSSRSDRNYRIVARLNEMGMNISIEEVEAESGGGSTGRPHIAAVLVRKGHVADANTAFDEYLGFGRPAYIGRDRLAPEEAIDLAIRSGAVPVLAHPHTLGIDNRFEMASLMERLGDAGLMGIECHYGTYDADGRRGMAAMARRFGLVPSGGSDYHGAYKPDVVLGTGRVGLEVPDSVVAELGEAGGIRW